MLHKTEKPTQCIECLQSQAANLPNPGWNPGRRPGGTPFDGWEFPPASFAVLTREIFVMSIIDSDPPACQASSSQSRQLICDRYFCVYYSHFVSIAAPFRVINLNYTQTNTPKSISPKILLIENSHSISQSGSWHFHFHNKKTS